MPEIFSTGLAEKPFLIVPSTSSPKKHSFHPSGSIAQSSLCILPHGCRGGWLKCSRNDDARARRARFPFVYMRRRDGFRYGRGAYLRGTLCIWKAAALPQRLIDLNKARWGRDGGSLRGEELRERLSCGKAGPSRASSDRRRPQAVPVATKEATGIDSRDEGFPFPPQHIKNAPIRRYDIPARQGGPRPRHPAPRRPAFPPARNAADRWRIACAHVSAHPRYGVCRSRKACCVR